MYPKKQPKSDREKFYGAFQKKVGCKPEQYLRRKLAGGMPEAELRRLDPENSLLPRGKGEEAQ